MSSNKLFKEYQTFCFVEIPLKKNSSFVQYLFLRSFCKES